MCTYMITYFEHKNVKIIIVIVNCKKKKRKTPES